MKRQTRQVDAVRQQIFDDHRAIAKLASRLGGEADAGRMLALLDELEPVLERHFRQEEGPDGLFDAIATSTPERGLVLQELRKEHRDLLLRSQRLRALAAATSPRKHLRQLGATLHERLRKHEAHETEVYLDSIWNETGEGD